MDKTLGIIIAAMILVILGMVILPTLVGSLTDGVGSAKETADDTKCEFQAREAEQANDASIVDQECLDYVDESELQNEAETSIVESIIS